MDELSSTEFRRRYATLVKPTVVTVSGHPIGTWTPGPSRQGGWLMDKADAASHERFNSQPFKGPIPKKGK